MSASPTESRVLVVVEHVTRVRHARQVNAYQSTSDGPPTCPFARPSRRKGSAERSRGAKEAVSGAGATVARVAKLTCSRSILAFGAGNKLVGYGRR
jgi:hypothetical protein